MLSCSQLPKIQQTGSYSGDAGACSPQPPICVHESGVFDTLRNLRSCPILEATKSVHFIQDQRLSCQPVLLQTKRYRFSSDIRTF
ncbi:hypothetical protein EB796_015515 [Bugula neritina]|uniref:Uncharacterized protein n=1 Tax=Bugula neritina TaxID=10212 RepID=A0A7J7JIN6_BUGNE|nr:hypothetical protein EB796_015515 [Bugula neritina]